MIKKYCFLFMIGFITVSPIFAMEKILQKEKSKKSIAWSNCTYLSRGPEKPIEFKNGKPQENYHEIHYRIGFLLNEIYHHISIEEIDAGDEIHPPLVKKMYIFNGFELANDLGLKEDGEVITDIQFIQWINWNTCVLKIHNKTIKFKILNDQKDNKSLRLIIEEQKIEN